MPHATDTWARLESLAATEQGRGSEKLAASVAGDLRRAVQSLTAGETPRVVILTGFAIPDGAGGWSAETDGPLGAVQLAEAGLRLGWDVRILTDSACADSIKEVVPAAVDLDVADISGAEGGHDCPALLARYRELGVTHLVSVERVGPSADGRPRNMRGEDIGAATACLHHVVEGGDWSVIGIGDGGNEIGMGRVPADVVERFVALGERVRCVVGAEALVVAGTSNWGAAALVAALAMDTGRDDVLAVLQEEQAQDVLRRLVAAGAVDGVSRQPAETVDGLSWPAYQQVVDELIDVVRGEGALA